MQVQGLQALEAFQRQHPGAPPGISIKVTPPACMPTHKLACPSLRCNTTISTCALALAMSAAARVKIGDGALLAPDEEAAAVFKLP